MSANTHGSIDAKTHALFHVFLTGHHGFLPNLEAHLGRLIVHKAAERRRKLTSSARLLGRPTHLAVGTAIIRTSLRLRRRRRAHHWDSRYMLRYRVVKRWRVRWGRSVGTSLHCSWGFNVGLMVQVIEMEMWLLPNYQSVYGECSVILQPLSIQ